MTRTGSADRLAQEMSPYLRQHAQNPADWYPWGEDARRLTRRNLQHNDLIRVGNTTMRFTVFDGPIPVET